MVMTHQAHNIPWQVLADVYVEEAEYWRGEGGGKTGTTIWRPRKDWEPERMFKALRHFARRLAATVQEFANTERLKYGHIVAGADGGPVQPMINEGAPLYAEEELELVHGILVDEETCRRCQQVGYWLERQRRAFSREGATRFGCDDGDLADVAKQLLNRGMVEPLLRLVRAGVRLDKLARITYSNFFHYGIRRVLDDGLELYILLNLAVAMGWSASRPHHEWPAQLRQLRANTLSSHDFDAQRLPNAAFFEGLKALIPTPEAQAAHLSTFLADLFRRLYQYHLIMAECGRLENWEQAVLCFIPGAFSSPLFGILSDYMSQLQVVEPP